VIDSRLRFVSAALAGLLSCASAPKPSVRQSELVENDIKSPKSTRAVEREARVGAPSNSMSMTGSLRWPLRGLLYARFGTKGGAPHDGIDLAAPQGTPVKVAAPGVVVLAAEQPGYGLMVLVDHGNGLVTLYANNSELSVKSGVSLGADEVLGAVGSTDLTSGPHLHFEVRRDGKPVDPLLFLTKDP
jgi:lipoprotein NlpD